MEAAAGHVFSKRAVIECEDEAKRQILDDAYVKSKDGALSN
jgi:hypothetical protein